MSNFSDMEIELDADQQVAMIELYVKEKLRPESQSMFADMINDNSDSIDLRNALYHAVLNDQIINCIEIAIKMDVTDDE